jgi:uncharacterized membrane protein (DUF106 family)
MDPEALQDLKDRQARISNIQNSLTSGDFKRFVLSLNMRILVFMIQAYLQAYWVMMTGRTKELLLPGSLQVQVSNLGLVKLSDDENVEDRWPSIRWLIMLSKFHFIDKI